MVIEYRPIDWIEFRCYYHYFASSQGKIYELVNGLFIEVEQYFPCVNDLPIDRPRVKLDDVSYMVEKLVLIAFSGPKPHKKMCCHRDDDKINNTISNLYWGTAQDNVKDMYRNGKRHKRKRKLWPSKS